VSNGRHDELTAAVDALAESGDGPLVQLHDLLDQREADPKAPLRSGRGLDGLCEGLEDPRQHVGGDADPGVRDRDHGLPALAPGGETDQPPRLHVLARLREEVGDHLGEPHGIREDVKRAFASLDAELVPGTTGNGPAGLDRLVDRKPQGDPAAAQLEPVVGDPRQVEKVVDESLHLRDLPIQRRQGPFEHRAVGRSPLQDLETVPDRRQRASDLVGQGGEEHVLATIVLVESGHERVDAAFRVLLRPDVPRDRRRSHECARRVEQRRDRLRA